MVAFLAPHRRSRWPLALVALLLITLAGGRTLHGQEPISGPAAPAHLAVIDGDVALEREAGDGMADVGMPFVPGDRLRTSRGRVEVLFPEGSALDVDEYSTLDLQDATLIRLTQGRVRLTVPRESTARFEVVTPAGTARIDMPGEYRVAVLGSAYGQTELAVVRGIAALEGDRGYVRVAAGERSIVWTDDQPGRPERYNAARLDAFDRWSDDLRSDRMASTSVRYLPPDLRLYGAAFDRDGIWQNDAGYGYVWYPSVDVGWRPYYSGYWASVPRYGWTWIGLERWAWPTHHYGRWGYARNRWFWIPERRWAPAWVSWGSAPGYVSWCPLGWDNRPVFSLSVGVGTGYTGWTAMPRERFGIRGEFAHRAAVSPQSLPPRTAFVESTVAPLPPRTRGVPRRDAASGRVAGRDLAVPRPNDRARDQGDTTPGARPLPRRDGVDPNAARSYGRPVPRYAPDAGRDPSASGAGADGARSAPPRYPFGDFRRGGDRTPPPLGGRAERNQGDRDPVGGPRAVERSETHIYLPPPTSGGARSRTEPPAAGPSERRPQYGSAPPAGGGSERRDGGGIAVPRAGGQAPRAQGAGGRDGGAGRPHDAGSRRPR